MRLFRFVRWLLPALMFLLVPIASFGGVLISVTVAPPVLPVYEQPFCPEAGWMWVPGYWAWGDDGYYWVPGEWVPAPYVGALWTPPWWGWDDGHYIFHDGYWGNEVGYYGGIDYGFGYMGVGFVGGEWRDGGFAYNTAVMRVNTTVIHNTYVNDSIVRQSTIMNSRHVAYSGGPGGIRHEPSASERSAMSGRHTGPTQAQLQHVEAAQADRTSYAKVNGGHPHTLAMARPAEAIGRARNSAPSRPEAGTSPEPRSSASRTESSRPTEGRRAPSTESRAPTARSESRPMPGRTEPRSSRPPSESRATPSRPESRPPQRPQGESRTVTPPRTESRPRAESRPAPENRASPSTPRPESREPRAEPRSVPETHAAPEHQARPAPRTESRPAPQHESRPAPAPKQEKPREQPHR